MRNRSVLRRVGALGAGVVLILGVAACGDSSDIGGSPSATITPKTAAVAFKQMADTAKDVKFVKGDMKVQTAAGDVTGTYAYKFDGTGITGAMKMTQGDQVIDAIITSEALYIGGAELGLPSGKKYAKIDLDSLGALGAAYENIADQVSQGGDLEKSISEWESANLTASGVETVNGVTATVYSGSIDPAKPPAGTPDQATKAFGMLAEAGSTKVTYKVWVGPDGLPIKMRMVTNGDAATVTELTYRDWDVPNDVAAPPSNEVEDIGDELAQLGGL